MERATMAETQWVCLERQGGRVQRVTLLDDDLRVIATHERDPAEPPDDVQLLRAVEVTGLTAALESAG
jgi:hypothetical protein